MSPASQRPGVLRETPDVLIVDTRELAWVTAPEIAPGARRQMIGGLDDEPQAYFLFLPPEFPSGAEPLSPAHATADEFWFTLVGERSTWEFDSIDDQRGNLVHHRPGVAIQRRPGAVWAVDVAFRSDIGWIGLVVRDPGGDPAGGSTPALAKRRSTGGVALEAELGSGIILDQPCVTAIDSRRADWEPAAYSGVPPVFRKVLGRYPSGDTKMQILFFPPGLSPDRPPEEHQFYPSALQAARHYHHGMLELLYVLNGEMPLAEWESVDQQQGQFVWWREGIFTYRRSASLHGSQPGETSVTGATILHFRLGGSENRAEPAFREEVVVDVPFAT